MFVNEYALVRTLGKGSFGKVKLGLNTTDHELYALKLIPKSRRRIRGVPSGAPLVAEAEVIQEINVMKGLDHPNIVRLVEVIGKGLSHLIDLHTILCRPTCPYGVHPYTYSLLPNMH